MYNGVHIVKLSAHQMKSTELLLYAQPRLKSWRRPHLSGMHVDSGPLLSSPFSLSCQYWPHSGGTHPLPASLLALKSSYGERYRTRIPVSTLATYGGRAFAYAGPTTWNSLPDSLKDTDISLGLPTLLSHLKTFFSFY